MPWRTLLLELDRTVRLPHWNLDAQGLGECRRTGLRPLGLCNIVQLAKRAAVEPSGNRVELSRHYARYVLHDCVMPRSSFGGALIYPHAR